MAKKLNISSDLTEGYQLYSVVSPLADYRLSFFINAHTGLKLKKYADLSWEKQGKVSHVSWYYYLDDQLSTSYYLIGNRFEGRFFIPAFKKIDFLFLVKSPLGADAIERKINEIRRIQQVFAVLKQQLDSLSLASEFLEVNEMHELDQVIKPAKKKRYNKQNRRR